MTAKSKAKKAGSAPAYGVHSEVGTLRKVLVCAPGLGHTRLTPSNNDYLLFDDVLWVQAAKRDHFDTALLGLFISNTATAVLMAPIALAVAKDLHASPYPFAMIVALAASAAFMTPISSPVNTLVVGPGGYTFGDFVKVGVPFTLVVMVVCVILVPILFPLYR
ncbi:MAG: SLC13 family permease [Desulfobacterales bacterium]